jgi:hypothetical protein
VMNNHNSSHSACAQVHRRSGEGVRPSSTVYCAPGIDALRDGPGTRLRRSRATAARGFVLLSGLFGPAGRAGSVGARRPVLRYPEPSVASSLVGYPTEVAEARVRRGAGRCGPRRNPQWMGP